jgi:hypothetical protein
VSSVSVDAEILHALRVCGFAATARLADFLSQPTEVTESRLRECQSQGLVRKREGRATGWSLTPAGSEQHARHLVAAELDGPVQTQMLAAYDRFLIHNRELKRICTDWQLRPAPDGTATVNDHGDQRYDDDVIARLLAHHRDCAPMFDQLDGGPSRFAGYRTRLSAATQRLVDGGPAAFATPMSASYHCVWMELHQDLLLTLGRERDEADGH